MKKQTSEKDIETYLKRKVERMGGKAYKFSSPGTAGVPDRLVVLPGREMFFVELKAPGRKPTPLQENRIAELGRLGQLVFVIDSREMVDAVLAAGSKVAQHGI